MAAKKRTRNISQQQLQQEYKPHAEFLLRQALTLGYKAVWIAEDYPGDYVSQCWILEQLIYG